MSKYDFKSITIETAVLGDIRVRTFEVNSQTVENEPQVIVFFDDDTKIVITQVRAGLKHDYDWYFIAKHMDEDENVLASFKYANEEQLSNGMHIFFKKMAVKGISIEG